MTTKLRNFPTCHCHPKSLDSASTPEAFAKRELELGTGTLTVTDHGSLGACHQVYDLARKHKLTPVIGLEAYFRDDNCPLILGTGFPKDEKGTLAEYAKYFHFTLHFLDQEAYETAVKLLSRAPAERHGRELKPLFDWAAVEELGSKNVVMTTGCLIGIVQRHFLSQNNFEMATKYYQRFRELVKPGNFYVEVFPHVTDQFWEHRVFVTLENGEVLRYHSKKKLRTNAGEIEAAQLAIAWGRAGHSGHETLLSVSHYRKWTDREPTKIKEVKHVEDFLYNECKPWSPTPDYQRQMNKFMMLMAKKYGDPILIADDSHFAHPEDKIVQDIRLRAGGDQWRFAGSYHRQDSEEAFTHFQSTLGVSAQTFEGWVQNCYDWSSRFKDFKFNSEPSLPVKFYPSDTGKHTLELIKKHGRMDWSNPKYVERLKTEINLLQRNGKINLLPYFFIGEEALYLYEQNELLTGPGRGSAAGLLLTYLLGITHVDPLRYDLSLERFLTLDRIQSGKLPDIDMDFPHRELLTGPDGWLEKRFPGHYAQISVDTKLKLKSSVHDVARVLHGRISDDIVQLSKKFTNAPQGVTDIDHIFGYNAGSHREPGAIETDPALKEYIKKYPKDWEIVQKCLGLVRQKGRHACAYVIANRPIEEFIPLTTVSDVRVTEYNWQTVEAVGGIKMDFLGINSLKDIQECIKLIQERSGVEIPQSMILNGKRVPKIRLIPHQGKFLDVWDLPSDQAVFNEVASGKTETVFQFNTPSAVKWLKHFNHERRPGVKAITSIEDMSAFTALDRPGPLNVELNTPGSEDKHNALVEYARRARGETPSKDILPIFDQLLPETYGVMVYQEQLQKTYQYFTGCTGAEAEAFRGYVAKKQQEKLQKCYPFFMEKATEKLGSAEMAGKVWEFYQTWGQYGFNKSHSVCYVIIGYACAWLKHYYNLEWWCAVLRNADKQEVVGKFWRHLKNIVDLPDVKLSKNVWVIENERLRAPIVLLHGVGPTAHAQLIANAPYESIEEFCQKIVQHQEKNSSIVKKKVKDKVTGAESEVLSRRKGHNALTRRVVNTLILGGAMDSLFPPNTTVLDMMEAYEAALAKVTKKKQEKVAPVMVHMDTLGVYQLRKQILPAYSSNLFEPVMRRLGFDVKDGQLVPEHILASDGQEEIKPHRGSIKTPGGLLLSEYQIYPKSTGKTVVDFRWTGREMDCQYIFQNAKTIEQVTESQLITVNDGGYYWAAVGFIEKWRKFSYGEGKKKSAVALTLDLEGVQMEFVKWFGDRKIPEHWDKPQAGAIVIVLLNKFKEDRPFVIDEMIVVQEPYEDVTSVTEKKEESA